MPAEEKNKKTDIEQFAPNLNKPVFVTAWVLWLSYQADEFGALSFARRKIALTRLSKLSVTDAVTTIEYSIDRGNKTLSKPNFSTDLEGDTMQPGQPSKKEDPMAEVRKYEDGIAAEKHAAQVVLSEATESAIEDAWQAVLLGTHDEYTRKRMREGGWEKWKASVAKWLDARRFGELVRNPDAPKPEPTTLFGDGSEQGKDFL